MTTSCDAVVLSCIDFRFQQIERDWLNIHLKNKTYDFVEIAGAAKDIDLALEELAISIKLHSIKEVYLINHEDCGAYGKEGTLAKHQRDLKAIKEELNKNYPNLKIGMFFVYLDGSFAEI